MATQLREPRTTHVSASAIDRLPVKTNGRIMVVRIADIDWIEADHDYVLLHVGDKSWMLRETIASIELRLAMSGFVRIHRSALVNVDRVLELRPRAKGEFNVILRDGRQLKMTRNYRAAVDRLVGLDI
jgi:two-component system, LytTR family, response regulator